MTTRTESHEYKKVQKPLFMHILYGIFRRPKQTLAVIALVAVVGIAMHMLPDTKTAEEKATQELEEALTAIEKHMILPQGDEPVLATVIDAEELKAQQAFFAGSEDGDQLIMFPRNAKAVIYSPARDIIVNVGSIQQSVAESIK